MSDNPVRDDLWKISQTLKGSFCRDGLRGLSFSGNGKWIGGAHHDRLFLWSLPDGSFREVTKGIEYAYAMMFSPDNEGVISTFKHSFSPKVGRWRCVDGEYTSLGSPEYPNTIFSLALSPDGTMLAAGSASYIVILTLSSGNVVKANANTYSRVSLHGLAFLDNTAIVSTGYDTVDGWDAVTGSELWRIPVAGFNGQRSLDFHAEARLLACHCSKATLIFRFENVRTAPTLVATISHRDDSIAHTGARFSPDGATFAVTTAWKEVSIYRTRDFACESKIESPEKVVGISYSPDGRTLALGLQGGYENVLLYEHA